MTVFTLGRRCGHCKAPLRGDDKSGDFCNETCQRRWQESQATDPNRRPLTGPGSIGTLR